MYSDSDYEKKVFLKIVNEESDISPADLRDRLNQIITHETDKPYQEKDYDLIIDCIDYLNEIEGKEEPEIDTEEKIAKIMEASKSVKSDNLAKKSRRRPRLLKSMVTACIVLLFLITGNIIMISTTGNNIYTNLSKIVVNRQKVQGSKPHIDSLFEKLKSECEKYNELPLLPTKFPNDFSQRSFKYDENNIYSTVNIVVGDKNDLMDITIRHYFNPNNIPQNKTSGNADLSKLRVNGVDIYLLDKGGKYSVTYQSDDCSYFINSSFGYNKIVEIVKSIE